MKALFARKLAIVGLGLVGVVVLSAMALVAYSTVELARFGHAETQRAVFIHSAGQALGPGVSVRAIDLPSILARLGYTETKAAPIAPGQYRRAGGTWDIYLREEAARIGLEMRGERIARVTREGKGEAAGQAAKRYGDMLQKGVPGVARDYGEALRYYEIARLNGVEVPVQKAR